MNSDEVKLAVERVARAREREREREGRGADNMDDALRLTAAGWAVWSRRLRAIIMSRRPDLPRTLRRLTRARGDEMGLPPARAVSRPRPVRALTTPSTCTFCFSDECRC